MTVLVETSDPKGTGDGGVSTLPMSVTRLQINCLASVNIVVKEILVARDSLGSCSLILQEILPD